MDLIYGITSPLFFKNIRSGQVSHAAGIVSGLIDNGINVTVVGPKNGQNIFSEIGGVSYKPIEGLRFKRLRLLSEVFSVYKFFKVLKSTKGDVLLIRKNLAFVLFYYLSFGLRLMSIDKASIIWEVNGFTAERLKGVFLLDVIYELFLRMNCRALSGSKGIYVVSSPLKSEIARILDVKVDKVVVINNGAPSIIKRNVFDNDSKEKCEFIFFGVFQKYNDFENVLNAFETLPESDRKRAKLTFVGYGSCDNIFKSYVLKNNDIVVEKPKSRFELFNENVEGKRVFGLIPLMPSKGAEFLSPIKLYEYASLGMPVLASDNYQSMNPASFVSTYKAGSLQDLAEKMSSLINSEKSYKLSVKEAFEYAENNSWSSRMKLLISELTIPD